MKLRNILRTITSTVATSSWYNWYTHLRNGVEAKSLAGDQTVNAVKEYAFQNWMFFDAILWTLLFALCFIIPWYIRYRRHASDAKEQRIADKVIKGLKNSKNKTDE